MIRGRSWQRLVDADAPRHSPDWYDQSTEPIVLVAGDRLFLPCEGGPSHTRLEQFPPRLEIAEHDGTYVLIDIGTRDEWKYEFVPRVGALMWDALGGTDPVTQAEPSRPRLTIRRR